MMQIIPGDLNDQRVIDLLHIHVTTARAETGRGSAHALDLTGLQSSDISVWTIWDDKELLGIGALKRLSADHGEVKSMHTAEAMRGRGAGRAMLRHIIATARATGLSRLSLETGSWEYFRPAWALYKSHGFVECQPFADYVLDPNSVFMSLDLAMTSSDISANRPLRIGVVGDYNPEFPPHPATEAALRHAMRAEHVDLDVRWIPTETIAAGISWTHDCDALWIAPGSPYRNMDGALQAIHTARVTTIPLLATCGGFQHVVLEYARNVLAIEDAAHAEYDPYASRLFITPLSCSLVGTAMQVTFEPTSRVADWYGCPTAVEQYYCNFGLNPAYQRMLHEGGLRVTGWDENAEARVVEIPAHPFFLGTLFVPSLTSTPEAPHPLVRAFLRAAANFAMKSANPI